jgi:raffinose/stachyose/melibiose transport system permease protein
MEDKMNKKNIYPNWFLLAPFLLYLVFFLVPALLGVVYSFTDWNVRSRGNISFIGLKNYIEIFKSNKNYASGILNTLKFTVISNIVKLIPALFLAILIQRGVRGHRIYQTIFYLPAVLPFLVIGLIFKSIFNYNSGLLNTILSSLGLPSQKWLSDLSMVWKSIYGVDAWRGIGYCMTIFLAGLNGIPRSYYEAAEIDGAGFWRTFWHITLPMLTGAITINLVFGITYGLKVFDIVYVLTNGGPGHATEVMTTYSYQLYANGWYGLASALNSILFVITMIIGVFVVRHMSRQEVQQ